MTSTQAGKQPNITGAHKQLDEALSQVTKSAKGDSAKHLENATGSLTKAKSLLETARKNKGSARPAAIDLIEKAQAEIDAIPSDASHRDTAIDDIKKAIDEVEQAFKNGR